MIYGPGTVTPATATVGKTAESEKSKARPGEASTRGLHAAAATLST